MSDKPAQAEVDKNFEQFKKALPDLLKSEPGKFAVLHAGELTETFDTFADAVRYGLGKFGKERFSIQEITTESVSLGYHSYALHQHSN